MKTTNINAITILPYPTAIVKVNFFHSLATPKTISKISENWRGNHPTGSAWLGRVGGIPLEPSKNKLFYVTLTTVSETIRKSKYKSKAAGAIKSMTTLHNCYITIYL